MSVCFCPYGKQVASGSDDRSIKIWDTNTGNCVSTLNVDSGFFGVKSISYSPAGDMIAVGCRNGKIFLVDAVTVQVKRSSGHSRYVTAVSYSCLFSNVWCELTSEHFTVLSRVFRSAQMGKKLQVAAGTTALEFGRRRLARACRP